MSSPQTSNPNQPLPKTDPSGDFRKLDSQIHHSGLRWMWICTAIVIVVACVWMAWGFGGTGGWWARAAHRSRVAESGPGVASNGHVISIPKLTGSGVAALDANDKKSFVGQAFDVNGVTVQENAGSHALWIGSSNSTPMLVVVDEPSGSAETANLAEGDLANVNGTIEKAPPAKQAQSKWSLSDDDTQRLEQQGVYIQATKLQPAEPLTNSSRPANS